jgi:hypothetical protein
MSNPAKAPKHDGRVDTWAILFMVVVVIATVVFWLSRH